MGFGPNVAGSSMLMPACLGFAATSVRTSVNIQSEKCAKLDQIFSPLTM